MKRFLLMVAVTAGSLLLAGAPGWGNEASGGTYGGGKPLYPGFSSIEESRAFTRYTKRSKSDQSKLLYLIDRFADASIEIEYGGYFFPAPMSANFARFFLAHYYKGQSPQEWIEQWCTYTIHSRQLVHVRLPDGSLVPGGQVLQDELEALERAISKVE